MQLLDIPNALAYPNWGQQVSQNVRANRLEAEARDKQNALAQAIPGALGGDANALAQIYKADPHSGLAVSGLLATQEQNKYERGKADAEKWSKIYDTASTTADLALANSANPAADLPVIRKQFMDQFAGHPELQARIARHIPEQWNDSMLPLVRAGAGIKPPEAKGPTPDMQNYEAVQKNPGFGQFLKDNKTAAMQFKLDNPSLMPQGPQQPASNDIETMAQGIASGQLAPLSGYAARSPGAMKIMSRVMQINPEYRGTDYATGGAAEKYFTSGKGGATIRSFNVARSHLETLRKLGDALGNGNVQLVNSIGNEFGRQTGSPAPTSFEAARKIVGDEIVKAIVGSGGGVADREEAAKTISAASTPAQLNAAIDTYTELMNGQLGGFREQYDALPNHGPGDFDKKFPHASAQAPSSPATGHPADIAEILRRNGVK